MSSKLELLSPQARKWLLRTNSLESLGHATQTVLEHLDQLGCPHYRPFIAYLTRYSGLQFDYQSGPQRDYITLNTLQSRPLICRSQEDNTWLLCFGSQRVSHVAIWMQPNGSILSAHGEAKSTIIASSVEIFLEDVALQQIAAIEGRVIDTLTIAATGDVSAIVAKYELPTIPKATDRYVQWWGTNDVQIGIRPSGAIFCPLKTRYNLTASWMRGYPFDAQLTEDLTQLLEPHLGFFRKHPSFSRFRDTGDRHFVEELRSGSNWTAPAVSFRVWTYRQLSHFYHTGMLPDVIPSADSALYQLLLRLRDDPWPSLNSNMKYCVAVGLAAFGHKEFLEHILNHLPKSHDWGWNQLLWAGQYLGFLLPDLLLSPVEQTEQTKVWLSANLNRLTWDDSLGFFRLATRT